MTRRPRVNRLKIVNGAIYYPAPLTPDMRFPITEKIGRDALVRFSNDVKAGGKLYQDLGFNDPEDVVTAHALLIEAFESLAESGTVRKRTETKINSFLEGVAEEERFTLEGGELTIWRRIDFPNLAGYCAYMLALLIGFEISGEVRRCKLSECRKFFWAALKRGPRPRYCCESHRATGAKREQRGVQP